LLTHPAGGLDRVRQDSLTPVLPDDCDAAPRVAARYSFILPRALRRPGIKTSLHRGFARSQTTLVQRMGGGAFLMGDVMTVPDIILRRCEAWAEAAQFPITGQHLAGHVARMRARPAFQQAMARQGQDMRRLGRFPKCRAGDGRVTGRLRNASSCLI